MSIKPFALRMKLLVALFRSVEMQPSWRRCLYFIYAISGLSLLTACASAPLIEGLEIDNESIIAVLAKSLREDPFFPDRARCISVSVSGKRVANIHNDKRFVLLKDELLKKNLYRDDEKCEKFDFQKEAESAADPEKFVDSPQIPIGVLISTGSTLIKNVGPDPLFRIFRQAHQNYCESNRCDDFYQQKFQILSVSFSQCKSKYYRIYGIGATVFHTQTGPGGLCISR